MTYEDKVLRAFRLDPPTLIIWLDSHCVAGWHTDEPATAPLTCRSVGWVIDENETAVVLAPHITEEPLPQRLGEITIPKVAIVARKVLRLEGE